MKENLLFKNKYILSSSEYKEVVYKYSKLLYKDKFLVVLNIFMILFTIFELILFFSNFKVNFLLLFCILYFSFYYIYPKIIVSFLIRTIGNGLNIDVNFYSKKIVTLKNNYDYDEIKKFIELDNYYLLLLKRKMIILKKDAFEVGDVNKFNIFIKNKKI